MMRQFGLLPVHGSTGLAVAMIIATMVIVLSAGVTFSADGGDERLWTDRPVHVDRASQTYERLPPRTYYPRLPDRIVIGQRPDILDGASFRVDGEIYIFRHITAPPPGALCKGQGGRLWTCGRQSMLLLRAVLFNQTLRCAAQTVALGVSLVECRSAAGNPELRLVDEGLVIANSDRALLEKQEQMRRARKGLWAADDCLAEYDNCW